MRLDRGREEEGKATNTGAADARGGQEKKKKKRGASGHGFAAALSGETSDREDDGF
jgi:hypothetical protein